MNNIKKWFHLKKAESFKDYFIRGILIAVGVIIVLGIALWIVSKSVFNEMVIQTDYEEFVPSKKTHQKDIDSKITKDIEDQTIMIFGVDKGDIRTDTILLVHFDSKTEKVIVLSVPRDTKVEWSEEQIAKAEELEKYYQSPCKITEMSAYGGIDNLRFFTIRSVEEMLDMKVDHYAVVNTEVIREIVDKLGGIETNVPRAMKYDDLEQDLHIDLQPGIQLLNGEQAEGLLRWRHNNTGSEQYAQGDIGRIETQQLFIKSFVDKITEDVSLDKLVDVITSVYSNVKTDVTFEEAIGYLGYISHISVDRMNMQTLIGKGAYQGGKSYYIPDTLNMMKFVDKEFYDMEVEPYEEWIVPEDTAPTRVSPNEVENPEIYVEPEEMEPLPLDDEETINSEDQEDAELGGLENISIDDKEQEDILEENSSNEVASSPNRGTESDNASDSTQNPNENNAPAQTPESITQSETNVQTPEDEALFTEPIRPEENVQLVPQNEPIEP